MHVKILFQVDPAGVSTLNVPPEHRLFETIRSVARPLLNGDYLLDMAEPMFGKWQHTVSIEVLWHHYQVAMHKLLVEQNPVLAESQNGQAVAEVQQAPVVPDRQSESPQQAEETNGGQDSSGKDQDGSPEAA